MRRKGSVVVLLVVLVAVLALAAGGTSGDADAASDDEADWLPFPDAQRQLTARVAHGQVARVTRGTPRAVGLEAGLPANGAYARGLRLDAALRHAEALREYDIALADLKGLAELAGSHAEVAGWRAKIAWQREQSEDLLEQAAYVAVMPSSVLAHYHLASAFHAKFLSARAFLGRGPRELWQAAAAMYREALRLDSRFGVAQLGLARLYADAGMTQDARLTFARLGRRREDVDLALHVAGYLTATGELEAAFGYLARASLDDDVRRWLLESNDFDPLRADPRFLVLTAVRHTDADGETFGD